MASRKVVLDRVHDLVYLPPAVARAIDTPVFQRLRGLKQLGVASYVYPGAVHTRFEHSIGVAHLARTLLHRIAEAQPVVMGPLGGIDRDRDETVLMLAGLCHDVGHGPFSHLFEDVVAGNLGVTFDHEAMSQRLTRRMLRGIDGVDDAMIDDVLTVMDGAAASAAVKSASGDKKCFVSPFDGPRGALADIVSNKRCGVDVDKLDYFLRDSLSCYGRPTVDARYARLFNAARVVQGRPGDERSWLLAFDAKVMRDLRELWTLRSKLHVAVYQHATVKNAGHVIGDVLALAEPHFDVDGRGTRLRDCLDDEDRFMALGDWILDAIGASAAPELQPARGLLLQLRQRRLYKRVVASTVAPNAAGITLEAIKSGILAEVANAGQREELSRLLIPDTIHITPAKHAGDDPLARVVFVDAKRDADGPSGLRPLTLRGGAAPPSVFSSSTFRERTVLVFLRRRHDGATLTPELEATARAAAQEWERQQIFLGTLLPAALVPAQDL